MAKSKRKINKQKKNSFFEMKKIKILIDNLKSFKC